MAQVTVPNWMCSPKLTWALLLILLWLVGQRQFRDWYGHSEVVLINPEGKRITFTYADVVTLVQVQRHPGLDKKLLAWLKSVPEQHRAVDYWRDQDKHRGDPDQRVTPYMEQLQSMGLVQQSQGLWELTYKGREVIADP